MAEEKQPIRLTQQRAEALLAIIDLGLSTEETLLRTELQFVRVLSGEKVATLRLRDVRLAAAKDAAAIIRHRYLHGEEPTTPHETLF